MRRSINTLILILLLTTVHAQKPVLLKDINAVPNSSNPALLTAAGNKLFFAVGNHLWVSDGTVPGTAFVREMADFSEFSAMNGSLFFAMSSPGAGIELWKSDGTNAGTVRVADINTGPAHSSPRNMVKIGTWLYFTATSSTNGRELWKTNGTTAGTTLVKDIYPGAAASNPSGLTEVNGVLYFSATTSNGTELWRSDGTSAGTLMVKDIEAGAGSSDPTSFVSSDSVIYFSAYTSANGRELWKTDGTDSGTVMILDIVTGPAGSNPSKFAVADSMIYFTADNGINGYELWQTNGADTGTFMIIDLWTFSSNTIDTVLSMNGVIYFTSQGWSGKELYRSDGTIWGTYPVKDIHLGGFNSDPAYLFVADTILYFSANDGVDGTELWRTDGTTAGTYLVKNIAPGSEHAYPKAGAWLNGELFFTANDKINGNELWKTDGTTAGTVMFKDLLTGTNASGPGSSDKLFVDVNGTLFFPANNGEMGFELWKTNGSKEGTQLVKDINFGPALSMNGFSVMANLNGTLIFSADDGGWGRELWKSDGTALGTALVKDIHPGGNSSNPSQGIVMNGFFYFFADDFWNGYELWRTDGTAAGTTLVKDINPGPGSSGPRSAGSSVPSDLYLLNANTFMFIANNSANGMELWKSDGTAAGTVLVKDINPGSTGSNIQQSMLAVNGVMYLNATNGVSGNELWKSDGTAAGTVLVKDIYPGSNESYPTNFINYNGNLFFSANDGTNGFELWKSDGTAAGTVMVKNITPSTTSSGNSFPSYMVVSGGYLYFVANYASVWKTDGTDPGTVMLKDAVNGPNYNNPCFLESYNGFVYFSATETANKQELWRTDGTLAGTGMFADINKSDASNPTYIMNRGGRLYFSANDGYCGSELWTLADCDDSFGPPAVPGYYKSVSNALMADSFVCYCDSNSNLLLSLKPKVPGIVIDSVSVKVSPNGTTHYTNGTGFVSNPWGFVMSSRAWSIAASGNPSGKVKVRFPVLQSEIDSVNNRLAVMGSYRLPSVDSLTFYTVSDMTKTRYAPVNTLAPTQVNIVRAGLPASDSTWKQVSFYQGLFTMEFESNALSGGGFGGGHNGMSTALPVELLRLTAGENAHKQIDLKWTTLSELNTQLFDVLRSDDGLLFETIGIVSASGKSNTQRSYLLTDKNIKPGQLYYYKLAVLDRDGSVAYSETITAMVRDDQRSQEILFPNPASGSVNLKIPGTVGSYTMVSVISAEGAEVRRELVPLGLVNTIDLSALKPGVYVVKAETDGVATVMKLIVM